MTPADDTANRLENWIAQQLPEASDVCVDGLDTVEFGHSAEMLALTLAWTEGGVRHEREVIVRMRPPEPGLLEPYDLERQFRILNALERTEVLAPPALWFEASGDVLGRPFFVMERVEGEVYERELPAEVAADPSLIRTMCESLIDEVATIHLVDLHAAGLDFLGDGRNYLDDELDRWEREMRRVQRGPVPALEKLHAELCVRRPEPSPRIVLVHGDAKPGNFAFIGGEISAVFDWELTGAGDPLADIGYLEILWQMPAGLPHHPAALTMDEMIERYQERTGFAVEHREWYRAFQVFKLGVIQLVGSMLFDAGHWNDPRAIEMAMGIEMMTPIGLRDLGLDDAIDPGPIYPRAERMQEAASPSAEA